MTHEQELEDHILQGMARAVWSHAFIQWATEVDPPLDLSPGKDWSEVIPPTPPGALQAAQEIAEGIGELNNMGRHPMARIFLATRRYAQPQRSSTRATEADQAFQFGGEVAQACLGTLDVPELGQYRLPEMTAELDDDGRSLSWDEGWTWQPIRPNPARWPNSDVQSLLFDKNQYSVRRAQRWAQEHGFRYGSVDEGHGDFIHLRQFAHRAGQPCATVDFGQGIEAVVCATRNPGKGAPEILIVQADPDEQTAIIRLLKKVFGTKPRFIVADNVGAAIGDLEVHEFMLVVSDVTLLGAKTGIDLFRYVQENYAHLVDRFVFLTDDEAAKSVHDRYVAKTGTADDVKRVIRAPATPPQRREAMTVQQFGRAVNDLATKVTGTPGSSGRPTGRFGDRKVFVAAIWRLARHDPRFAGLTLDDFKRMLLKAHQEGIIDMARADLVGAMDPGEVAESETRVSSGRGFSAEFHFVIDPRYRA